MVHITRSGAISTSCVSVSRSGILVIVARRPGIIINIIVSFFLILGGAIILLFNDKLSQRLRDAWEIFEVDQVDSDAVAGLLWVRD